MKTVLINSCNFGSTGNIMLEIAETAENGGYTAAVCYPQSRDNSRKGKGFYYRNSVFTQYTPAACRDNGT